MAEAELAQPTPTLPQEQDEPLVGRVPPPERGRTGGGRCRIERSNENTADTVD